MRRIFILPVIALCIFSCATPQLDPSKKQNLLHISYGPYGRNVMDVSLPANRSTQHTPVVIFIHGGAWILGDKFIFRREIDMMAEEGIAAVTINYRFVSEFFSVHHPTCTNDVRAALDFIVSKSSEWQVSPDRFGLVGHSAGGHMSLLTAYNYNYDGRIKACASWAGPVDLLDQDQLAITGAHALFATYMGLKLITSSDTIAYKNASPYWTASSSSVPTLLVYGTQDIGVPYSNCNKMKAKLDELGVPNEKLELTGANHIWIGYDLALARKKTIDWFKEKL